MEPIKSGSFTYSLPGGFLNCGVPRADKKALANYLNPVRPTRNSQNWTPPKLTGKWCKAQLAHYGIKPLAGSKSELETRLRVAEHDGLLKKQPAEMKLLEKYMKKEWKAKKDESDKRVKREIEDDGGDDYDGVYVKADFDGNVNVKTEKIELDDDAGEGTSKIKIVSQKRKPAGTKVTTTAFSKKHILGTWDVTCPEIQTGWASTDRLTMVLFQDIESSSVVGELIFGVMEGVFKLKSNPSTKNPVVEFYWAGTVGEEDEIQLREREGEMRFYNRGEKARGSFECIKGIGQNVEFEAVKIGDMPIRGRVDFGRYGEDYYE